MCMSIFNTNVDDDIVQEFRNTIYDKSGLKRGDFQKALQEAIQDYTTKHSGSSQIRELPKLLEHKLKIKTNGDF